MIEVFSDRLVVRPFLPADITDEYLGWLNDKELMRYSRQQFCVHTRESCRAYLDSFEPPNEFWNVSTKDGVQVGTLTTYVRSDSADVGILIGRGGQGYGSEAFGAALTYLFATRGVALVTAGTAKENVAMIKIAERWGMRLNVNFDDYYQFARPYDPDKVRDFLGYTISGMRPGSEWGVASPRASSSLTKRSNR